MLQWLGRREKADQIIAVLEGYAAEQPDENGPSSLRRQCWETLCLGLLEMGRTDQAWETGARSLVSTASPPPMFSRLDRDRWREAQAWWIVLRHRNSAQTPAETIAEVYRVLNPPADEEATVLHRLVADAEKFVASSNSRRRYRRSTAWRAPTWRAPTWPLTWPPMVCRTKQSSSLN